MYVLSFLLNQFKEDDVTLCVTCRLISVYFVIWNALTEQYIKTDKGGGGGALKIRVLSGYSWGNEVW